MMALTFSRAERWSSATSNDRNYVDARRPSVRRLRRGERPNMGLLRSFSTSSELDLAGPSAADAESMPPLPF